MINAGAKVVLRDGNQKDCSVVQFIKNQIMNSFFYKNNVKIAKDTMLVIVAGQINALRDTHVLKIAIATTGESRNEVPNDNFDQVTIPEIAPMA